MAQANRDHWHQSQAAPGTRETVMPQDLEEWFASLLLVLAIWVAVSVFVR